MNAPTLDIHAATQTFHAPDDPLNFTLPLELEAHEPPEVRGIARDAVRLMVSYRATDQVVHRQFSRVTDYLHAGDVVIINTSGTLPAALKATRADNTKLEVHFSTKLPGGLWLIEVRKISHSDQQKMTLPFFEMHPNETLTFPAGGSVTLQAPYRPLGKSRLWIATLNLPVPLENYLQAHGFPIRYGYVQKQWPISAYQTVYVTEDGSAEMPSAGRAFTPELMTRLVAQGVQFAPLVLHTGVASLESDEPPYEEYFRVPAETAALVSHAHAEGRRVIAVGTTCVRAIESVTDERGATHAGEGYTSLVISPERGLRVVDGLLTGLHEPRATHFWMLEALAGRRHLRVTYAEALRLRYLWHEFGDLHLILP